MSLACLSLLLASAINLAAQSNVPADQDGQAKPQPNLSCGAGGCVPANPASDSSSVQVSGAGETGSPSGQAIQIHARTGDTAQDPTQASAAYQSSRTDQIGSARRVYDTPVARPTTDFERYVQASTGRTLQTFGLDYFRTRGSADFSAAASLAAPADFVLGPGDQVHVRTVGSVSVDVLATVDRNGFIFLPEIGTVQVAGLQLSTAQAAIRSAINRQFRNFELTVTLGQLRSIQVFLLGEAQEPGVHTVSALGTLINALFASGGPSPTGSLRDIQLKRNGQTIVHLDVYDLLLKGDKSADVRLEPGDIIYIPVIGPQTAVDGDVNKPAIFELRGPTTVEQLIQLAGGLTPVAATDRASLDRIVEHQRREVQDFPLTGAQRLINVQGGDVLRIFPISPRFDKSLTLRGNVGQPGRYAWHEGMRVSDLIPSRQFLITRRYYNEQNALTPPIPIRPFAVTPDQNSDSPLENAGTVTADPRAATRTRAISQDEAAASATAPLVPAAPPQAELGNHDTEINWTYAVIERLDPQSLKTNLVPFALGEAIDNPVSSENKTLQPGDVVTIYSRNDINLPVELRARFVRIDGEVMRPGVYRLEGNETLRDLVTRAGGIAPHGYFYAAQLTRESVRIAQDAKIQQYVAQAARDVLSPANQQLQIDGRAGDLETRRAYVTALSQIRATGRITLQLVPGATALTDIPELALQDGDRFFVPPQPTTVDVLGNVFNAGSLVYTKGATVHHYLKLAGDRTRTGDKGQEFLLRADGTVLSRETHSRFDRLLIYPGDTIIVPPKLKTPFNFYQLVGLTQSFGNIAITALALSTIQ